MTGADTQTPDNARDALQKNFRQSVLIDVADIDVSGRLRPIDRDVSVAIAADMRIRGQLQPIDVCRLPGQRGYKLVDGAHRVDAVKISGWPKIEAIIRSADALERRQREIVSTFIRAELAPLDRAAFVREYMETEKARLGLTAEQDGRAMNGDYRSPKIHKKQLADDLCTMHKSLGLQGSVAERLGLTQSSVSRHLALNGLAVAVVERVRAMPAIAQNANALRKLAAQPASRQHYILDMIDDGLAKDVNAAIARLDNRPAVDQDAKRLNTFFDAFARMTPREREGALTVLTPLLPKGVAIAFEDNKVRTSAANEAVARMRKPRAGDYTAEDAALSRELREQREAMMQDSATGVTVREVSSDEWQSLAKPGAGKVAAE